MKYKDQRGVALLVVLWACTLLAILVGGFAAISRTEALQVRNVLAQQRVRYAAESGVMRALVDVYAHRHAARVREDTGTETPSRESVRWIGDGRPFDIPLGRVRVRVTVVDETGKVDINAADVTVLRSLFLAAGCPPDRATALADSVLEWRSPLDHPGDGGRARYAEAGLSYGPRRNRFAGVEELQSVIGMDAALYAKVESAITLWSGRSAPEPSFAPVLAVAALPGMDLERARAFVSARDGGVGGQAPTSIAGLSFGGAVGGNAVTIRSEADDGQGARVYIEATVRYDSITPVRDARRAIYTIVRWRDGVPFS